MKRQAAIAIAILAAIAQFSCSSAIPPVPTVPLNGLDSDVQNAIETARKEAVAQSKSGQASGRLGMVLQAHTLYPPAVLAYQRAIRLEPKEFAWRYYLGLSLQQSSNPESALESISDALKIRPDYAPAILKRAELLFKQGRFKESDESLGPLLARDPDSAPTLYLLARVKYAETDFAAAEDLYRRACQAYPNFGAAWYGLAETGKRIGHADDSAKFYSLAESHKNDKPPEGDELLDQVFKLATGVENRLAQAKELMGQRKFDEASRLYKEVLKQYPDNPDALVNLLYMAQFPNQATPSEAESLYVRARSIGPKVPQVYMYYGTALASQGKFAEANAAINKAIELKPDDPEAQSWLADLLEKENQPAQAIAHYRLALAAQPSFRPARLELAKLLLAQGHSGEAIPVLLPALQVDDSYTTVVMMFLAQAYANSGDKSQATDYLKQARARALKSGPPQLLAQIEQGLRQLGSPL